VIKQTVVILDVYHFVNYVKNFISILMSSLMPYAEEIIGIINVDFDTTGQLLIIYSAFVKYLRKKLEYNEAVHHLLTDFKNVYYAVGRAVVYNVLIEFGIPMTLVRLIKMSE